MRIYWLLVWMIGFQAMATYAQSETKGLPVNDEFQLAVDKGTRTMKGLPGPNYFQNHADYDIKVEVVAGENPMIKGRENIVYFNESPDELTQLVIRLFQDFYKRKVKHDFSLQEDEYTEGVTIQAIAIEDQIIPTDAYKRKGTNLYLPLPEKLLPGDSIALTIVWTNAITKGNSVRMGSYPSSQNLGKQAFFVAYWYPQIAVYDDLYGWDEIQYTGLVEHYLDLNDYKVEITAAEDFLVWSTGILQNPDQILASPYLDRYQLAQTVDTVVRIVGRRDIELKESGETTFTRQASDGKHTWKFTAPKVPDVAFSLSNYYYWDATSLTIDEPARKVIVDACYNPLARDFRSVAGFAREILEDLSTEIPGIPYPYDQMTVFNGEVIGTGGGMEFPMIVNDGSSFSLRYAFNLTYHEIAHTYFPFYMGINERRFAWMDEGWASLLPGDLEVEKGYASLPMKNNVSSYERLAGNSKIKPLMTPSYELKQTAYYIGAYMHPATAYHMLRDVMGDSLFVLGIRTYIDRWKEKHPHPYDFFFTFDEVAGEDLSWFWEPWFFTNGIPELGIESLTIKKKNLTAVIKNNGTLPTPIHLVVELRNGEEAIIHYSPSVWKDGAETFTIEKKFDSKIVDVNLGRADIPDKSQKNNEGRKFMDQ
ncbi:MAG: M1 family metallopeptidase [Bacteroidota bacterium]